MTTVSIACSSLYQVAHHCFLSAPWSYFFLALGFASHCSFLPLTMPWQWPRSHLLDTCQCCCFSPVLQSSCCPLKTTHLSFHHALFSEILTHHSSFTYSLVFGRRNEVKWRVGLAVISPHFWMPKGWLLATAILRRFLHTTLLFEYSLPSFTPLA